MGDLQWNDVKQHLERNIFEQVCEPQDRLRVFFPVLVTI